MVREIASGGCARFKENRRRNDTHVRPVLPPSPTRFRARRPQSSRRRRRVVTSRRAGDARKSARKGSSYIRANRFSNGTHQRGGG